MWNFTNITAHCAKLYNSKFAHIVKHGDTYAVRRRLLFRTEYLDLNSIMPASSIEGGVVYSKENNYGQQPQRVYWWDKPRNILKYCVTSDIEVATRAHAELCGYEPDPEPPLPEFERVEDVDVERAFNRIERS